MREAKRFAAAAAAQRTAHQQMARHQARRHAGDRHADVALVGLLGRLRAKQKLDVEFEAAVCGRFCVVCIVVVSQLSLQRRSHLIKMPDFGSTSNACHAVTTLLVVVDGAVDGVGGVVGGAAYGTCGCAG